MSLHMRDLMMSRLGELRYEPIDKRIRALIGDDTVVDSIRARLVWEPKRVVPEYAVPEEDVRAPAEPAPPSDAGPVDAPTLAGRRVYDPSVPFAVRETPGEPLALRVDGRTIEAFRPA